MRKWSEEAWKAASGVYTSIIEHPFVEALADGSLPRDRFMHYLRQDSLYLGEYFRVLAHIASRLPEGGFAADFISFAADGVAVEKALHESFLGGVRPSRADMSPACCLYTSLLMSQSYSPVEVEAAAVLPCFWVYQRVGEEILRRQKSRSNPYMAWIATYADEAFAASTRRAIDICDALADAASPRVREEMTDVFVRCTRMEWLFWDSAWNLEKWKI